MKAYLSHATSKGDTPRILKNAFGTNPLFKPHVGIFVDQGSQLSFDFERDPSTHDLLYIFMVNDINE